MHPLGLDNFGKMYSNVCYSNSTIQTLLSIPEIREYCTRVNGELDLHFDEVSPAGRFARSFVRYVATYVHYQEANRKGVVEEVRRAQYQFMTQLYTYLPRKFPRNGQADAAELFEAIFDTVVRVDSQLPEYLTFNEKLITHPVTHPFHIRSVLIGRGKYREHATTMVTVSDELHHVNSLTETLDAFLAEPQQRVLRIGRYIIVDVPRDENREIDIPVEYNFRGFVGQEPHGNLGDIGRQAPIRAYKLLAAIQQLGGKGGGHYVSQVRYGDNWFLCNDSSVTRIARLNINRLNRSRTFVYQLIQYDNPGRAVIESQRMEPFRRVVHIDDRKVVEGEYVSPHTRPSHKRPLSPDPLPEPASTTQTSSDTGPGPGHKHSLTPKQLPPPPSTVDSSGCAMEKSNCIYSPDIRLIDKQCTLDPKRRGCHKNLDIRMAIRKQGERNFRKIGELFRKIVKDGRVVDDEAFKLLMDIEDSSSESDKSDVLEDVDLEDDESEPDY